MGANPFYELLTALSPPAAQAPGASTGGGLTLCEGVVEALTPLRVGWAGLHLKGASLRLGASLAASGVILSGTATVTGGSVISFAPSDDDTLTARRRLAVGDRLLMLTADAQTFYIIDKVVDA